MERKNKRVLIISLIALILVVAGASYAYFSARITGLESASTLSMTAGTLGIHYTEGNEEVSMNNIYPKEEAWLTKTFTLTGTNTTELKMKYKVGLNIISNEFTSDALTYDLTHEAVTNGKAISEQTGRMIKSGTNVKQYFGEGYFTNTAGVGIDHEYELKIYFKDNGLDQNINQGKVFNAKIFVEEGSVIPVNKCYTDKTSPLDPYITGQYVYIYNYGSNGDSSNPQLIDLTLMGLDGWSVVSKETYIMMMDSSNYTPSTDPINEQACTSINDKPIVWMVGTYYNTPSTSIDVSSFDTSDVVNMGGMFTGSQANTITGLDKLDTSSVTDMSGMFYNSQATSLNVSNFDTSSVTDMTGMFNHSQSTMLDVSNFDTSNVTIMDCTFCNTVASTIAGLNNFDTSNVTNMRAMFQYTQATTLDLSSFDTTNVTNMRAMFSLTAATQIIGLDHLNTSNVTNMEGMFQYSQATSIDLSSFDTSNVTKISYMFEGSEATTLDLSSFDTSSVIEMIAMFRHMPNLTTIYASNKFDTSSVTYSATMFSDSYNLVGGNGTHYDANHIDDTY
ncbi:MAG TPA: hypothetical protein DCL29_08285, partial [Eubacterium sp.]|nr:hypothetical protein [Eubacterium sp.]